MSRLRVFRMDDLVQTATLRMNLLMHQPCGDYSVAGRFLSDCFLFQAEYRERKTNQHQVLCIFDDYKAYDNPLPLHSASCFDACSATGEVAVGMGDTLFWFLRPPHIPTAERQSFMPKILLQPYALLGKAIKSR